MRTKLLTKIAIESPKEIVAEILKEHKISRGELAKAFEVSLKELKEIEGSNDTGMSLRLKMFQNHMRRLSIKADAERHLKVVMGPRRKKSSKKK